MAADKGLTFWQRLYLPEIIKGMAITASHFFINLLVLSLRPIGIRLKGKGPVTIRYPEERRELAPRLRSLHRLTRREDGSPRCVACMMCETVCPAYCIYIVAAEHADPDIEKYPIRFDIDLGVCVFCGYCVEACPVDAIRMDSGSLDFATYSREDMIYKLDDLLKMEPARAKG